MNLLVTGGYGFIGSHFINYYFMQNERVQIVNLDAMYYCASKENVLEEIRGSPRYVEVIGNIQDAELVKETLLKHKITHVIHFAAQSHVQNSFEDSIQYTKDNVLGTHVLLEACREWGNLHCFVHISTDEVYGESMDDLKDEGAVLCPTNPYAATKAAAELIARSYYQSFGMPIIVTRGNNVYGPNQYPEKLLPLFINLLKENRKVTIQGDGSCVRSFLYVADVVRAFELILERGEVGEIYNIGGNQSHEYSVMEIARHLIRMLKGENSKVEDWITYIEDRPFNDRRYYISSDKVRALGWDIEYDLQRGLKMII